MANFRIQLGVQLDKNASKSIGNQLNNQKITANISKFNITKSAISDIKKQLNSSKFSINIDANGVNKQINSVVANINKMNKLAIGLNNLGKLNIDDSGLQQRLASITKQFDMIKRMSDLGAQSIALSRLDGSFKMLASDVNAYNKELANSKSVNFLADQAKAVNNVKKYINENTKAAKEYGDALQEAQNKMQNAGNVKELTTARKQFSALTSEIQASGNSGRSFGDELKNSMSKFSQWISAGTIVMQAIRGVQNGFSTIVALDDAMIELKKVTDGTTEAYRNFYYEANNIGKTLGAATEQVIAHTAAWAQMGLTIEDAVEASKVTSIFKTISPEMTDEDAEKSLISTMKAYGIDVEDMLDKIASKINIVGNNLASTNNDIAQILQRSASAMAAANNSLEQNISLGVAANEVVQMPEKVGNALKSVAYNIRSLDEESGTYDKTLESIKENVSAVTGISAFTDEQKQTYKSTYQYLSDISDVFDELTDKQQAGVASELFGKYQSNTGLAILKNFESARKAMELMEDSDGNALEEFEKATDSISFKLNALQETFTGVWQNILDSDAIKTGIDLLTNLLQVIQDITEAIGSIGTLGAIGGGILGAKGLGWANVYVNINSCRHNLCPDKA